jgi:hypothetical protein
MMVDIESREALKTLFSGFIDARCLEAFFIS